MEGDPSEGVIVAHYMYQPSAPGRDAPGTAPAQPVPSAQPGAEAPKPAFDPTMIVLLLVPLMLFFFMSRSQTKKQKELETSLKVGDKVVLRSGMIGKIIESGDRMKIEIAPGVKVECLKSAIEGKDVGPAVDAKAKESAKEAPKEPSKDKDKPQEKKA